MDNVRDYKSYLKEMEEKKKATEELEASAETDGDDTDDTIKEVTEEIQTVVEKEHSKVSHSNLQVETPKIHKTDRKIMEALKSVNDTSSQITEALRAQTEQNRSIMESHSSIVEALNLLVETNKTIIEKLDAISEIELPTPVINMVPPKPVKREVLRDSKGKITGVVDKYDEEDE